MEASQDSNQDENQSDTDEIPSQRTLDSAWRQQVLNDLTEAFRKEKADRQSKEKAAKSDRKITNKKLTREENREKNRRKR